MPTSPSSRVSSSVLLSSVWQLLLHVLIPASLANEAARQKQLPPPTPTASPSQPHRQAAAPTPPAPNLNAALLPASPGAASDGGGVLQCCDLVLVRTPGFVYRQFRRLASHSFDHLAIAVSADSVLHVGPPNIRLLPASLLLQPRRRPLVIRPQLTDEQRAALIHSLTPLVGQPYDTLRVLALIARLATAQTADKRRERRQRLWRGGQWQPVNDRANDCAATATTATAATSTTPALLSSPLPSSSLSSLICTDAILNRLLAVSPRFRAIVHRWQQLSSSSALLPLDFHTMHSWTTEPSHSSHPYNCQPRE